MIAEVFLHGRRFGICFERDDVSQQLVFAAFRHVIHQRILILVQLRYASTVGLLNVFQQVLGLGGADGDEDEEEGRLVLEDHAHVGLPDAQQEALDVVELDGGEVLHLGYACITPQRLHPEEVQRMSAEAHATGHVSVGLLEARVTHDRATPRHTTRALLLQIKLVHASLQHHRSQQALNGRQKGLVAVVGQSLRQDEVLSTFPR